MRISGCTRVLGDEEVALIHEASVRFLEEVGIGVEHDRMLDEMTQAGYTVDRAEGRVTFPAKLIGAMVDRARGSDQKGDLPPTLVCHTGGSPGFYFDPHTETVVDHTTRTLADAIRLADAVPEVDWMNIMGFATDIPPMMQLLFHKIITWSCTEKWCSANEINDIEMFPHYRALCETYCNAVGKELDTEARAVFYTAHPYLIREGTAARYYQAEDEGLQASLSLGSIVMGLNTPATVAGAVTVGTIVSFVRSLVGHALSGRTDVPRLGSVMGITSKIDARTARVAKAGPEACLCALAACDMARFYGVPPSIPVGFQGQGKETASFQTGYEKGALLPNVMAGGTRVGAIGCISQPEHIFSPMQLLLDAELVSMFRRFYEGFEVTEDTIGFDAIRESSQTGIFLDHPHTAAHYRQELWQTSYSVHGISYNDWSERQEDFGYAAARSKALEILETHRPSYLPDDLRAELRGVIERAASEVLGEEIDDGVWDW